MGISVYYQNCIYFSGKWLHGFLMYMYLFSCTFMFFVGFPGSSAAKESTCNAGDLGLIHGLGRSPGEGKGYLPHYSGLESMGSQKVGHN